MRCSAEREREAMCDGYRASCTERETFPFRWPAAAVLTDRRERFLLRRGVAAARKFIRGAKRDSRIVIALCVCIR